MDASQKPVRSMQIFANLLHAFSSNSKSSDSSVSVLNPTPLLEAREGLLSVLPRVIGTLLSIWGVWNLDNPNESLPSSMALLGTAKVGYRLDSIDSSEATCIHLNWLDLNNYIYFPSESFLGTIPNQKRANCSKSTVGSL